MSGWVRRLAAKYCTFHYCAALCCVVLTYAQLARPAGAAEVRLQMKGGAFEIAGELKGYDGTRYTIESLTFGTMTLDASRFDCVGAGCPKAPITATAALYTAGKGDLGTTTWVGGSGIGTDFMPELVKSYAASVGLKVTQTTGADPRNLEFRLSDVAGRTVGQFNVLRHGVPEGLEALRTGTADVVWSSSRISDEEAKALAEKGLPELRVVGSEHMFALDALLVLVSKQNPAASISVDTLAAIYAGRINDWGELGLPPGKINVYAPVDGMGTFSYFQNTILKPRGLELRPDAVRLKTAIEWSDRVAADPMGISTNFIAYVRNAKALNVEASCGLITRPTVFAAKTEEYPLSRRLYLYSRGQPKTPLARELLAHALSPGVQKALKAAGFVDQDPEALEFAQQTSRIAYALNAKGEDFDMALMRSLISDLKSARRLSTTFHFQTNSFVLDTKGQGDVGRLRDLLTSPEYSGKTVMLVGFSDSVGAFAANLKLAERRAGAVQRALLGAGTRAAAVQIETKAYGELAPVACNDSFEARQFNRRVEVWVHD